MVPTNPLQPYQNMMTPMMPQGMIWLKGKNEANNYPMARGTTLPLFDQENEIFYVKTVDVYGNTQPLRVFKYEEITQADDAAKTGPSISVEDFNVLKNEIAELREELKKMSVPNDNRKPYRKENRNNGQ